MIASIDEPVPAWIESFNGPVGIFVACGKGLSLNYSDKDTVLPMNLVRAKISCLAAQ